MLEDHDVELMSAIKYGYVRDDDGFLTQYKSGDRFVFVKPLDQPFPRNQTVGIFSCVVIHHGKESKCIACGEKGHKVADNNCKAKPEKNILAFKSYEHPLSNHYPCKLEVFDEKFKSVEEAYFWRMSSEMGKPDLAKRIQKSHHAGEAKKLSKEIADDLGRLQWEKENVDVMVHLLEAKAKQCGRFYECLMESEDSVLAEATPSRYWGTGLSIFVTKNCSESYWPGQNMLGALLMQLRGELMAKKDGSPDVQMEEPLCSATSDESASVYSGELVSGNLRDHLLTEPEAEDSLSLSLGQPASAEDMIAEVSTPDASLRSTSLAPDVSLAADASLGSPDNTADNINGDSTDEPRRPRERLPHLFRANRSLSESNSKSRGNYSERSVTHSKTKDKKQSVKAKNEQMKTPQQTDIRKVLGTKRMAEGSPEDKVDAKLQKQEKT